MSEWASGCVGVLCGALVAVRMHWWMLGRVAGLSGFIGSADGVQAALGRAVMAAAGMEYILAAGQNRT